MWVTLTEQLGLITETEDGLVLSPCRALMYDVLALAPTTSSEDPDYDDLTVDGGEVQQMLNWVNDNLFTIYEARTGTPKIHPLSPTYFGTWPKIASSTFQHLEIHRMK